MYSMFYLSITLITGLEKKTDHLSSLLKRVVSKYIQMRLKTYGKKYTAEIAHGNKVSKRHQLTKLILFSNR